MAESVYMLELTEDELVALSALFTFFAVNDVGEPLTIPPSSRIDRGLLTAKEKVRRLLEGK